MTALLHVSPVLAMLGALVAMALRAGHGTGAPALLRSERRPLDEIPPPNAEDTAAGLAMRQVRGRPFAAGNAAAKGRRPALASSAGMPLDAHDPDYQRALGWARRYRARRVRELGVLYGGELSAGVCAMLTSSALDMAASRYLTILAARSTAPKTAADLMTTASRLAQASRQQELTAIDVAQHEHAARKSTPKTEAQVWAELRGERGPT